MLHRALWIRSCLASCSLPGTTVLTRAHYHTITQRVPCRLRERGITVFTRRTNTQPGFLMAYTNPLQVGQKLASFSAKLTPSPCSHAWLAPLRTTSRPSLRKPVLSQ